MLADVPKRWWSGLGPIAKWTFYPLDAYPEQIRLLVELTPLYQGVDLLRSLAVGVVGLDDVFHALYLTAMGIIGLLVVSRRLDKLLLK